MATPLLNELMPSYAKMLKTPTGPILTNPSFMGSQSAAIPVPDLGLSSSWGLGNNKIGFDYGDTQMNQFFGTAPDASSNFGLDWASKSDTPGVLGKWIEPGKLALGFAQVGLGVKTALDQERMNKFMRSYYGDQMEMQKTDFANVAKSTNNELQAREARRLDAMGGPAIGSQENQDAVAKYMEQWGVKESFA